MRQLNGHDASLIYADSPHANSNVTLLHIYDPSTAPGGRVRFERILAHVGRRLERSPVFRQRLLRVPLELDFPWWVEDEHFDLEYHVRHIALPSPGDWRQFCLQAARIHARPLDLSRPLWELYVIEGLDAFLDLPQGSFAVLAKVHHAAVDVEGGNEITRLLHDESAEPVDEGPPAPWFPERPPGRLALAARGALHSLRSPLRVAGPLARAVARLAPAAWTFASEAMLRPERMPVTRFNSVVTPHRVFETRRFELDAFRRIRGLVPGARVSDAVVAVCAGGLRRYLESHGELPAESLSAMGPVLMRESDPRQQRPEMSWLRIQLGTQIADPVERLAFIHGQTASSETLARALDVREFAAAGMHAPAAALAVASRMMARAAQGIGRRAPLASCAITNVPGPSRPLYLDGARMTYFSAIMPISDGMGLVFAVTSYDGKIIISPTACREQMPDPEVFAQCLRDSFQELLELADAKPRRSRRRPAAAAAKAGEDAAPPARPVRSARPRASAPDAASRRSPGERTAATRPPAARAGRRRSGAPPR